MKHILILALSLFTVASFAQTESNALPRRPRPSPPSGGHRPPPPSRSYLTCDPFLNGWQVHESGVALGQGYFNNRAGCNEAIDTSRNGFVCAAENGGAIVVDAHTHIRAGAGWWNNLSSCEQAVLQSTRSLVCGAERGGAVVYSRRANGLLGTGYYSSLQGCAEVVLGSANGLACGPQNGGAAVFTLEGTQIGAGWWAGNSDCNQSVQFVRNGYMCAPESGAIRMANIYSGLTAGPLYSNLATCQRDL